MMKFNINNYVKFKPTKLGLSHYKDKRSKMSHALNIEIPINLEIDKDGFAQLQMHEFMHYFGNIAYCGGENFIENCEIFLSEDCLQSVQEKALN